MNTPSRLLILLLALFLTASACALRSSEEETEPSAAPAAETDVPALPSSSPETEEPSPSGEEIVPVVPEVADPVTPVVNPDADADYLVDGMFIYGDAVYTQAYYSENNSRYFSLTAQYYSQLFGTRVSMVIAPLSSMMIDNPKVTSVIADQKEMLNKMKGLTDPSVNFVDPYDIMYQHRSEYLYFRTDHHWTQRGAYYAYCEFARSVGLTPVSLDSMTYVLRNDHYAGSMYDWTMKEKVKSFEDKIEAWYPSKAHTMTVLTPQGETVIYDSCIVSVNDTYVTFLAGDNPYTVIEVPENPQDMTCLVLKDSFANAFVPFLVEHYGTIIVVDTRYVEENIHEKYKSMNFDDILFVNNIEAANSYVWSQLYMGAIGQELP